MIKLFTIAVTFSVMSISAMGQPKQNVLHLISDSTKGEYGYANAKGDIVIPLGKYNTCYTKRFDDFAIVWSNENGLIGIDRKENVLFHVFIFDMGPDYTSNGLFRIEVDGKIGYANLHGRIVIPPEFDCAYPFEHGKAKVGVGCKLEKYGEHSAWTGGEWHVIDKRGKTIKS